MNVIAPEPPEDRRRRVLGTFFLPYQERWVNDEGRLKLCEKSRQTGLTFTEAYRRTRRAGTRGAKYDAWVSTRDLLQARLFVDDCKAFAKALQIPCSDVGESIIGSDKDLRSYDITLASGRTITGLSSNPDAQAGKRGDRTLDEFGLHKEPRKIYALAQPGIMWGGQLSVFSTHRGSAHYFNELVREITEKGNPKKWSHHKVTIEDAVRDGLLIKIQDKVGEEDPRFGIGDDEFLQLLKNECPDEDYWLQEYCCVPSDDSTTLLAWADIVRCSYAAAEVWQIPVRECVGRIYVGVDIGRKKDLTVITCGEQVGEHLYVREVIELSKRKFSEQEEVLWNILSGHNIGRCAIDATGIGMQMAERAAERFGEYRVIQQPFTMATKNEMAYPLKTRFEDATIHIPDDRTYHADLRGVKTDTTAAGNKILKADNGAEGHSDRFWSLALMVHAAATVEDPGLFARLASILPGFRRRRSRAGLAG